MLTRHRPLLSALVAVAAACAVPLTPAAASTGSTQGVRALSAAQLAELEKQQASGGGTIGGDRGASAFSTGGFSTKAVTTTTGGAQGVDVSRWNGSVDWSAISAQGNKFAYVKATEGTSYLSPTRDAQYSGARNAGLLTGSYHFALPPRSTGAEQARFFVANGGGWSRDGKTLPPVLDMEFNPYPSTFGNECYDMTPAQLSAWVSDFVRTMDQLTGRHPVIYTNKYWWDTCVQSADFGAYPVWMARYSSTPPAVPAGWGNWTIWQYTESGALVGDHNVFNGSYTELLAWAQKDASIGPNGPASTKIYGRYQPGSTVATSPNGLYRLVMQTDGNLVTYDNRGKVVFSTGTSAPGHYLDARGNGDLVLVNPKTGQVQWVTPTRGATSMVLQDDGNLVIRNSTGQAMYDSFGFSGKHSRVIDTAVKSLAPGESAYAIRGGYRFTMNANGNLVGYRKDGTHYFSSKSYGVNRQLAMQANGNATIMTGSSTVWSTRTAGNTGAALTLRTDGRLVVTKGASLLWKSH